MGNSGRALDSSPPPLPAHARRAPLGPPCLWSHVATLQPSEPSEQRRGGEGARMSSPPKEKVETKAGHLPAVKAGGMRIVKKHQGSATPAPVERDKESEEWESNSPKPTVPIIISGAVARGDKDFPPAAAQVAHQKPYPSVEKLPVSHQINHSIHQPRK